MASEELAVVAATVTPFKYSDRVVLRDILERGDGGVGLLGARVVVGGWVRSAKEVKKEAHAAVQPDAISSPPTPKDVSCVEVLQTRIPFLRSILRVLGGGGGSYPLPREKMDSLIPKLLSTVFLQVSDGSSVASLKVVVESTIASPSQIMPTGTCILVEGVLKPPAVEGKHVIELQADKILHIGTVDQEKYPLSKKRLPIDSLREFSHFKPRTTTVASIMRMRNSLTHATHTFFQNNGFLYVQLPIITTTDAEGFSQKFIVATLSEKSAEIEGISLEGLKVAIKEKSKLVEELKRSDSNKEAVGAALRDLRKTNELAKQLESKEKLRPSVEKGDETYSSKDFFSCQTYLTVSGRLHLQSYACSLGNVYSFGPRFRAERYHSVKNVAEMWVVELEMAFSELEDAMNCAEDFLKFLCKSVLESCVGDINFFSKRFDKSNVERLQSLISSSFERISYAQAVEALQQGANKFEKKVEWGVPLTEEHESYLAGDIYRRPVIIYNYPKKIKPFYTRVNDDGKTVAAFDVVVPQAGTLIRGSQNEERFSMLSTRMKELGIKNEEYEWYMELRRHGTVKSSGLSVAFEQVVLFATGLVDVADVIPFPRTYGKANN